MLSVDNVNYDLLLLSLAKKYGLEASETIEFANFVMSSDDHSAIQKKYKEIYEKGLTNEEWCVIINTSKKERGNPNG